MKKRRIGDLYDKAKFNKAFEDAVEKFVSKVMGEFSNTDKGARAKAEAIANLKKRVRELPVELYRILDAYIDGEDISEYGDFYGFEDDYKLFLKRDGSGLVELINALSDGLWAPKDVKAAESYYNERVRSFNGIGDKRNLTAAATPSVISEEKKKRLLEFDSEKKRILGIHKASLRDIRREHAAFISQKDDIERGDAAKRLLSGLYAEFSREHKTLVKMEKRVMSLKRKMIPLEVEMESGEISEKKLAIHDRLLVMAEHATRDLECYMNALDELNEVRYRNGIISKDLYLRKIGGIGEPKSEPSPDIQMDVSEKYSAEDKGTKIKLDLGERKGESPALAEKDKSAPDDPTLEM